MTSLSGSCLCGSIRYEVTRMETRMGHCHCTMCRKFHGSAFATLGEARTEHFKWVSGREYLKSYRAENGTTRQFCSNCGSSLTFAASNDSGDLVEFALGTLDSPLDLRPDAHLYVGFKSNWYDINDNLPKYPDGRDSDPE